MTARRTRRNEARVTEHRRCTDERRIADARSTRIDRPVRRRRWQGRHGRGGARAFLATRPPFMIAAVTPVLVGTAWAGTAYHRFDGLLFGLALGVMLLAHAAANVYNDVGDDITGADPGNVEHIYPYTGGSRFIQAGLLSRAQMTRLALVWPSSRCCWVYCSRSCAGPA